MLPIWHIILMVALNIKFSSKYFDCAHFSMIPCQIRYDSVPHKFVSNAYQEIFNVFLSIPWHSIKLVAVNARRKSNRQLILTLKIFMLRISTLERRLLGFLGGMSQESDKVI